MCGGSQQTSTTSQQIPPWLENAGQQVVEMAGAQAQQPYQAYTGQGVAPMSQLQNQAISGVGSFSMLPNLQNYMNLTDSAGAANTAAGAAPYNAAASNHFGAAINNLQSAGSAPTALGASDWYTQGALRAMEKTAPISGVDATSPYAQGAVTAGTGPGALSAASPYLQAGSQSASGGIGSYMNPFQSQVMDEIGRRAGENLTENILPGVNATFTGAGQFGSSRNADFTNRAIRDTQREALAAQSAAGQQGWNTALAASQNDLARQLQAGQTAGALRGQDMSTAVNAQLGAGNLALQGANTDINKWMGVAGQQANLANMQGNFANTDANRYLNIAQQQQGLGNSQAGLGANVAGQLNVDAQRQLAAANQGTNQGIAAQNMYNTGIDRLYGYGATQQGQQQQENAWNYGQWQQQQQYPWQQIQNYAGVLRGSPSSSTSTTSAPGANPLNTIIGGGLALGALRPWSWFADGGPVKKYASGGSVLNQFTDRLDALADRFDDPALQGALALLSSRSSGVDLGALGKTMASAQGRQREKAMLKALADRRPVASSTPGGALSAGGSGLMRGVRPYWDDDDIVGYAEGGAIRRYDDGGGVLGYFKDAGNWIDKLTGYSDLDDAGPLTQRYEAVAGKLPERSRVNAPLLQAAGALLASRNRNVGGALGEGLMAFAGGTEAQRKLAMGEKMMQAQILGALQKENDPSKYLKFENGRWFDLRTGKPTQVGEVVRPLASAPFGIDDTPGGPKANPQAMQALADLKAVDTGAALDEYMAKAGIDAKMKPALEAAIEQAKNPALIARSAANAQNEAAAKAPYTAIPVPPGGAAVLPFAGMGSPGALSGGAGGQPNAAPTAAQAPGGTQPPAPGAPPPYSREQLPGGGMVIREGSGLGQASQTKLEEAAIDTSNQLSRLDTISKSFKPEYLQVLPKIGRTWDAIKEKGGVDLSPDAQAQLADFTKFRRDTVANLNQTIKDITGAAMSEAEAKRITAQVPNAGQGIFDGDSPTEFKAKLDAATQAAQNALLRTNWARSRGINPLKTGIELDDVPGLVNKRGRELNEELRKADPHMTNEQRRAEVKKRLGVEFGLVR